MKKTLLLAAVGLLAASSMDAATIYFDNSKTNWPGVYTWEFGGPAADFGTTTEQVTIDGHVLYKAETTQNKIIFRGANGWGQGQTDDIVISTVGDNAVMAGPQGSTSKIAQIVDGQWVAEGNGEEIDPADQPMYIRGSFTETWSLVDDYKFTKQEDGTYTIKTTIYAGGSFKVFQGTWATSWGGPEGGNNDDTSTLQTIEAGKSYTLVQGEGSKNLYVPANLVDVTFTFDPTTATLTLSGGEQGDLPELDWFCAWDFEGGANGSTWSFNNKMEKQEEGTYKISVDNTNSTSENNYFAIFRGTSCTGWDDPNNTRFQPKGVDGDQTVDITKTYPMQEGNSSTWKLGNGKWTVVVDPRDPNNMTVSFNLGDSTGEANVLIDRIADTEYDGIYESYAMEETEGDANTFTWEGTLNQGDRLKFNIHGVDYYYDPSNGTIKGDDEDFDNAVTIDYPLMTVTEENNGEVTFDYTSAVKITVDVDNTTVTVDVLDAPRVSLTLTRGAESQIHAMTREDATSRVYTCHPIMCEPGDRVDFRLLNTRYVFVSSDTRAAETYTLKVAEEGEEAPELPIETSQEITFTVDAANSTLTMGDGVNTVVIDITAAENAEVLYFNLQGIQIERPENGMFIEVRGNKASKVMVK